jgi:hypothetical protein
VSAELPLQAVASVHLQRGNAAEDHFVCFLRKKNLNLRLETAQHVLADDVANSDCTGVSHLDLSWGCVREAAETYWCYKLLLENRQSAQFS